MKKTSDIFIKSKDIPWENPEKGVQRQILGYDEQVMLVHVKFEKGAVGSAHHHPHRQVTYVAAGKFSVEIDGENALLAVGDSFIVPPNAVHGVVAEEAGALIDVFTPAREDFLRYSPGR